MDMVSWSLNAIDQIYSTLRNTGKEHVARPGETYLAGYVFDAWKAFQAVCLGVLSLGYEGYLDLWIYGDRVLVDRNGATTGSTGNWGTKIAVN